MGKLREITIDLESLSEEVIYKYGDYHAGFRELLQNASDAIKDYEEVIKDKDKKFSGFISVTLFPRYIVIKDNGIGLASKEIDQYLLRLYGTDKKEKERAGIFGRGFFAIFKESKEIFVITQRPSEKKVYLKVYPKDKWFVCEELALKEIPNKFLDYTLLLEHGHGTNLIVIPNSITFNIDEIHKYLIQTCQFFEIPLVINGHSVNKTFLQAVEEDMPNRAIVDFNEFDKSDPNKRITGCLAYQTANNMIQAFVYRIKVLNLISPVDSVCGYINYDQLKVVPSRDALVQDENYHFFIRVLSNKCDEVMKKLSEKPQKDDYQALLNYAILKRDPSYILRVPLYKIVGEREKFSINDILNAIATKMLFYAKKRNLVADRLRKRGFIVITDFSEKEFEMLQLITEQQRNITFLSVESQVASKLAGLGKRYIVPDDDLSSLEKKILNNAREMVDEFSGEVGKIKVFIIKGDLIDEAEHIPGQIWIQREGKILNLAKKITRYPTLVKMLLTPLIAHEITHENDKEIHDETFYEILETNLKKMQEKLIEKFLNLEKKSLLDL
ncbi:MAG: ATP-binding protein [Candidatus Hodarchaeota archaeon]